MNILEKLYFFTVPYSMSW